VSVVECPRISSFHNRSVRPSVSTGFLGLPIQSRQCVRFCSTPTGYRGRPQSWGNQASARAHVLNPEPRSIDVGSLIPVYYDTMAAFRECIAESRTRNSTRAAMNAQSR